jgi:hypothetical protein
VGDEILSQILCEECLPRNIVEIVKVRERPLNPLEAIYRPAGQPQARARPAGQNVAQGD